MDIWCWKLEKFNGNCLHCCLVLNTSKLLGRKLGSVICYYCSMPHFPFILYCLANFVIIVLCGMLLQALCTDPDMFLTLNLNDHWMRDFFVASLFLDLQQNAEGLARYRSLYVLFPRSDHILAQTATAHYNLREFDEAEGLFEEVLQRDPYRIEGNCHPPRILLLSLDQADVVYLIRLHCAFFNISSVPKVRVEGCDVCSTRAIFFSGSAEDMGLKDLRFLVTDMVCEYGTIFFAIFRYGYVLQHSLCERVFCSTESFSSQICSYG